MSTSTVTRSVPGWQDVVLSFLPPDKRTTRARERLLAARLPLILIVQAALTWRLNDIASNDEALYINSGHVVIAYLLHGGAANAALVHFYDTFFSGAPYAYPIVEAALDSTGGLLLVRLVSLFLMLAATVAVHRIGRHLFAENVGLLAALIFALSGSVQYIGKYATYDAPCLALIAAAAAVGITKRSVSSAAVVGFLLVLASVTKYAALALVPFVLLMTFIAPLTDKSDGSERDVLGAALRGGVAAFVFGGLLLSGYCLWGSAIATGLEFTTTGRKALDPQPMHVLLQSLFYDIGLTYALAICGILLVLGRGAWPKAILLVVMLGAGSVIQISSLRIHEFTSLDKHTAFTGLFCAVPAGVALAWALSQRGREKLVALAVIWLLLIDGMWRSNLEYSWPSSIIEPINEIKSLNISGRYFSFDSDSASYYTQGDQSIVWYPTADAFSTFSQGLPKVVALEESHEFTGFLFQTTNLGSQDLSELHVLQRLLASDPYYFKTSSIPVNPYTTAVWQLWIHYPVGYHGPSLKVPSKEQAGMSADAPAPGPTRPLPTLSTSAAGTSRPSQAAPVPTAAGA
jgi:hypothetical protein